MNFADVCKRFLRSRSGLGLLLHVSLCALLSAAVGYGVCLSGLDWFKEHKSEEKVTALQLVDAFVTNYAAVRSQLGGEAPVPATFRAHSIELFNQKRDSDADFRLRWVGRQGREIRTAPTDARMAATIEAFAAEPNPKPQSEMLTFDAQPWFRTVYPTLAQQSCVDCHNRLQPNAIAWRLNDVMGAFVIDVPAGPFVHSILLQSVGLGLALFLALALVGLAIAVLHFRQMAERETAAGEISRAQTFLHTIIENMPLMVSVNQLPEQRYVLLNRAAEALFGIPRNDMIGRRPQDVLPKAAADVFCASEEETSRPNSVTLVDEHVLEMPQGGARTLSTKRLPILGEDGAPKYLLNLSEDITERKRAEERIAYIAYHDALTDLPNRAAFSERLASTLDGASAGGAAFAVVCVDLFRLKEINDTFGYAAGDALLCEIARQLRSTARGAFVARLGGDEFALIATGDPQPATAEALATRLLRTVADDLDVGGRRLRVSLSVGIAVFPADGTEATRLLANADAALHRAKAEGGGTIRFFESAMDQRLRERRALQDDLRFAVPGRQLVLHYQPQALIGGKIIGFEALARWEHPVHGRVSPDRFIPLAEESGLIVPIGEWILREACREAASWPRPLQIAVNLSPVQFRQGELAELVHAILIETGLAPDRLHLEITEGVLVDDFSRALSILRRLKTLGVHIAMDDFGTGYSSLSYLQAFPFDKIKIDRTFIANLERNPQSAAIVSGVIGLARGLSLPVLAEGVETESQLAFLAREACDEIQGYLIGQPCPMSVYGEWVRRPVDEPKISALAP
ncbi:MAG: EAL domain-containing protein [Methylobacteriaceae bacterium]|nr:EAL domain-containing protein [Methylobacteriaceae bacterium]